MLGPLNYNSVNIMMGSGEGRGRGKRKACLMVEEESTRIEKRSKQISQSLIEASRKGDIQLCIQAIRDGADITFQSCGLSPLFYAVFYGHSLIIAFLVICGAPINDKNLSGATPLAKASESHRPDIISTVQCLIKHGADPNIADDGGNTPLLKAIKNGNIELAKYLAGVPKINVNKENLEHSTALHEACFKGNKELVDILINANANVNKRNSSGKTPLHRAILGNHLGVAKSLLDNGADINAQDNLGYTPSHLTAISGNVDSIDFLVHNGADLEIKDTINKKTCMEIAKERRHYPYVEFLGRLENITIPLLNVSIL